MKRKLALVSSLYVVLIGCTAHAMQQFPVENLKITVSRIRNTYSSEEITPDMLREYAVAPTGWLARHHDQLAQLTHFPSTDGGAVSPVKQLREAYRTKRQLVTSLGMQAMTKNHANYVFRVLGGPVVKIAGYQRYWNLLAHYMLDKGDFCRDAHYKDEGVQHATINHGLVSVIPTYQTVSHYAYSLLAQDAIQRYNLQHLTQPRTNLVVLDPDEPVDDNNVIIVQECVSNTTLHAFIEKGGILGEDHMHDMATFCYAVEPPALDDIRISRDTSGRLCLKVLGLAQSQHDPPSYFFKKGHPTEDIGVTSARNRSRANTSLITFANIIGQRTFGKVHLQRLKSAVKDTPLYFKTANEHIDQKLREYKE